MNCRRGYVIRNWIKRIKSIISVTQVLKIFKQNKTVLNICVKVATFYLLIMFPILDSTQFRVGDRLPCRGRCSEKRGRQDLPQNAKKGSESAGSIFDICSGTIISSFKAELTFTDGRKSRPIKVNQIKTVDKYICLNAWRRRAARSDH